MNDILKALSTPLWWLSVIIAGFAVNIAAAYAKPLLDRFLSSISSRYKAWSTDRKERIGKVSFYLLDHPQEAADLRGQVLHLTLKLVLVVAAGLFFTQALEFIAETSNLVWQAYIWLKIFIYFCTAVWAVVLFRRYVLFGAILKDYDNSVYSAADRYQLKKYD